MLNGVELWPESMIQSIKIQYVNFMQKITIQHKNLCFPENAVVKEYLQDPHKQTGLDATEVELYEALLWACSKNDTILIERLKKSPTPWLFDEDTPLCVCVRNNSIQAAQSIIGYYENACTKSITQACWVEYRHHFLELFLPQANFTEKSGGVLCVFILACTGLELQKYSKVLDKKIKLLDDPGSYVDEVFNWIDQAAYDVERFKWVVKHVPMTSSQWKNAVSHAVTHQKWDLIEYMKQSASHPVYIANPQYYSTALAHYDLDEIERVRSIVDFEKYKPDDAKALLQKIFDGKIRFSLNAFLNRDEAFRRLNIVQPLLICLPTSERKKYISKMSQSLFPECINQLLAAYPDVCEKDLFPDVFGAGGYVSSYYFNKNKWSDEEEIDCNVHQVENYNFYSWDAEKLTHSKVITACCEAQNSSLVKRVIHYGAVLSLSDVFKVLAWPPQKLCTQFIQLCVQNCMFSVNDVKHVSSEQWEILAKSPFGHVVGRMLPLHENMGKEESRNFFKAALCSNNIELVNQWKHNIDCEENAFLTIAASVSLEMVKEVVEISDPFYKNSQPLWNAVKHEKVDVVKYLIPLCNPKADNSVALRKACELKNVEIVKLLLPVSEPRDEKCSTLRVALENPCDEIVQMLLPVSNIKLVRSLVEGEVKDYFEEQISVWEKRVISEQIGADTTVLKSRRMM